MELNGSTFRLRPWRIEDAPSLSRHGNNRKIWINLPDGFPSPYTLEAAKKFIEESLQGRPDFPGSEFSAIDVGGQAIGSFILMPKRGIHRGTAEIAYWLGEEYWGRGIATEAVRMVTRHGFEVLGLRRVSATVFGWNERSGKLLEKAGYRFEGRQRDAVIKDGRVTDHLIYAILPSEMA